MFLYKVYDPAPVLQPFVSNYAIVENTAPLTHYILMKAALVLTIQYAGSMELSSEEAKIYEQFRSGLMGVQQSYRTMHKTANTGVLFINFTEAGAAAFFRLQLHELSNKGLSLDLLLPASMTARLEEQVALAATADERVRQAESFLFALLQQQQQEQDPMISAALEIIKQAQGNLRTEDLAAQLCISIGRLEKRFRKTVGISPKKYASMIRMETILRNHRASNALTQTAYEAGYFDQAHFNRDFKLHTGLSPKQLFSSLATVDGNAQQPCGFIYGSNLQLKQTDQFNS